MNTTTPLCNLRGERILCLENGKWEGSLLFFFSCLSLSSCETILSLFRRDPTDDTTQVAKQFIQLLQNKKDRTATAALGGPERKNRKRSIIRTLFGCTNLFRSVVGKYLIMTIMLLFRFYWCGPIFFHFVDTLHTMPSLLDTASILNYVDKWVVRIDTWFRAVIVGKWIWFINQGGCNRLFANACDPNSTESTSRKIERRHRSNEYYL